MKVVSKTQLNKCKTKHPTSRVGLNAWEKLMENCFAEDLNDLKQTFGAVDYVRKNFYVFNISGNNFRIVANIDFINQTVFLIVVGNHSDYDKWVREKSRKMNYLNQSSGMPELTKAWATLQDHALLRPIRNDADYERVHALAVDLSEEVAGDHDHPLFSLFELTLELIEHWEEEHVEIPHSDPKEVLRFLLEQHNLKQKDLSDIASPTLISDILAGRREISKSLAKSLGERFNVSAAAFI